MNLIISIFLALMERKNCTKMSVRKMLMILGAREDIARAPRICPIFGDPSFSQKSPHAKKNCIQIEKKGPEHDTNIFLAPSSTANKTGTKNKTLLIDLSFSKKLKTIQAYQARRAVKTRSARKARYK